MINLDEKYQEIVNERKEIIMEINKLEKSDIITRYNTLKMKNENLYQEQLELIRKQQRDTYNSCNHIWVTSRIIYDDMMNTSISECGCIKCGLDENVINDERVCLSYGERIMYDCLKINPSIRNKGIKLDLQCDLDLAKAIYCKIKEAHPNIDDKTAIKYFKVALDNIRSIKVSSEREENRAKRLQLTKHFRNWQSDDIMTN